MQLKFSCDLVRFPAILSPGQPARVPGRGTGRPCQQRALSDPARKEGAGGAPRYGPALSAAFISIQFWQPRSLGYSGEAAPVVLDLHFPSSPSF